MLSYIITRKLILPSIKLVQISMLNFGYLTTFYLFLSYFIVHAQKQQFATFLLKF